MGEKITEQLDYIPGKLVNRRHIRHQYKCQAGCDCIKIASMPNQPIDKGIPGPGLLTEILIAKHQDSMPLYRQITKFKRFGYELSASTLGGWIKESAIVLQPMIELMRQQLLAAHKIHTDDTHIPVIAKGKTKQGRFWAYVSENSGTPAICIYNYSATRQAKWPGAFLKNYQGYLQADAYSGYDHLYKDGLIIEVGCLAHARRKLVELTKNAPGPSNVDNIIQLISKLYVIEKHCKSYTDYERYHYRKRYSKPILKKIHKKIAFNLKQAVPGLPFYKALKYFKNHWIALTRYLAHGCLSIDNNLAERTMRPIAIGRKNWMFAGNDAAGERAAVIYSIIETCKMNSINTFDYLQDVLTRLPNTLQKNLHQLLPYNWVKQPV